MLIFVITRKNALSWVILAGLFVIVAPVEAIVIAGVVVLAGYLVSLQVHPHRNCRSCDGTGRHSGAVWGYANRACGTCGGSPRHRRWGAQYLHASKQVRAEARAQAAGERRARPL
jgi:hypothetical protein